MTRYLLVHDESHEEYVLPESSIPREEKLHDAFESHPELFPSEELSLGQVMVVGREVVFESGAADLICVDEGGQVVIVELKKGTENPDSRKVVAQMLDYGAHLWGYTFDRFETEIALPYLRKKHGAKAPSSLREAASALFSFEDASTEVELFAQSLTKTLEAGSFVYAIIARTFPPTLSTVLRYVGEISRLQTAAIAVDFYHDGERHIMAPRVVFTSAVAGAEGTGPSTRSSTKTTLEQFLQDVGPAAPFWSDFIEYLTSLPGSRIFWGQKGFSYRLAVGGKQYTVLRGYPRTAWWLMGKAKGDELEIITSPSSSAPESLRRSIANATAGVCSCEGAVPMTEGDEKRLHFYTREGLTKETDEAIRQALKQVFERGLAELAQASLE